MRLLQTISLSNFQKMVLSKIISSPNPKVAATEVSANSNLVRARDMLAKLDIIEFSPTEALVKPKGIELMKDRNLLDQSGALTPEGEKLAAEGRTGPEEQPGQMERFDLFKSFN